MHSHQQLLPCRPLLIRTHIIRLQFHTNKAKRMVGPPWNQTRHHTRLNPPLCRRFRDKSRPLSDKVLRRHMATCRHYKACRINDFHTETYADWIRRVSRGRNVSKDPFCITVEACVKWITRLLSNIKRHYRATNVTVCWHALLLNAITI